MIYCDHIDEKSNNHPTVPEIKAVSSGKIMFQVWFNLKQEIPWLSLNGNGIKMQIARGISSSCICEIYCPPSRKQNTKMVACKCVSVHPTSVVTEQKALLKHCDLYAEYTVSPFTNYYELGLKIWWIVSMNSYKHVR